MNILIVAIAILLLILFLAGCIKFAKWFIFGSPQQDEPQLPLMSQMIYSGGDSESNTSSGCSPIAYQYQPQESTKIIEHYYQPAPMVAQPMMPEPQSAAPVVSGEDRSPERPDYSTPVYQPPVQAPLPQQPVTPAPVYNEYYQPTYNAPEQTVYYQPMQQNDWPFPEYTPAPIQPTPAPQIPVEDDDYSREPILPYVLPPMQQAPVFDDELPQYSDFETVYYQPEDAPSWTGRGPQDTWSVYDTVLSDPLDQFDTPQANYPTIVDADPFISGQE